MVEHAAVNRRVVGSSPTWGAKNRSIHRRWVLLFFVMQFEDGASNPAWEQPHRLLTGPQPCARSAGESMAAGRKKQGESAPLQGAEATFVSDRFGRWFESNLGSQKQEYPSKMGAPVFCYAV